MKLTIDTQVDTYEDIKKVLHILNGILEKKDGGISSNFGVESYGGSSSSSNAASGDTSNLMSMFGDDGSAASNTEKKDNPPDFSSFLNLVNQNKDDKPKRSYSEDLGSVQVY